MTKLPTISRTEEWAIKNIYHCNLQKTISCTKTAAILNNVKLRNKVLAKKDI